MTSSKSSGGFILMVQGESIDNLVKELVIIKRMITRGRVSGEYPTKWSIQHQRI